MGDKSSKSEIRSLNDSYRRFLCCFALNSAINRMGVAITLVNQAIFGQLHGKGYQNHYFKVIRYRSRDLLKLMIGFCPLQKVVQIHQNYRQLGNEKGIVDFSDGSWSGNNR
ncbi:MAG: hypothetical protein ACM3XO_24240 [Bacteroidota bacterium]